MCMCGLPRVIERHCQLFGTLLLCRGIRGGFQRFYNQHSAIKAEVAYQPAVDFYDPASSVFALEFLVGKRIAPDNNFAVSDLQNPAVRELPHWVRQEESALLHLGVGERALEFRFDLKCDCRGRAIVRVAARPAR